MADPHYVYNMTVKMFGPEPEPAFESPDELLRNWGRVWGCQTDVGKLRTVLMHRPGTEFDVIDPNKRIESIGSFGDPEEGWYFQSETIPPLAEMQQQHDGLVDALRQEGVEVVFLDGVSGGRFKSCYTRDSVIAVKGGGIVCRMAPRMRRGEELVATRTLAGLGAPILRTLQSTAIFEGGSFAWLNAKTAVVGRSIRVNDEGIAQVADVLQRQGVELLVVDLCGYDIHIDGALVMVDVDLALVDPVRLPYRFLQELKDHKIRTIEITPEDDGWIINSLAVRPGRVLMPPGASERTQELFDKNKLEIVAVDYNKMQLNGGGIHCSTCPLLRDPAD